MSKGYDRPFKSLTDVNEFEKESEETWLKSGTIYNAFC